MPQSCPERRHVEGGMDGAKFSQGVSTSHCSGALPKYAKRETRHFDQTLEEWKTFRIGTYDRYLSYV